MVYKIIQFSGLHSTGPYWAQAHKLTQPLGSPKGLLGAIPLAQLVGQLGCTAILLQTLRNIQQQVFFNFDSFLNSLN